MIIQKAFYFVRHGQTDHNISEGNLKGDHPEEISLNATGRMQAEAIESLIVSLPVDRICASPLQRVHETKEIIARKLELEHHVIDSLGECSAKIWKEMMSGLRMDSPYPSSGDVLSFLERVSQGINHALSLSGTPLVVAHGGIHWALCYLLGIKEHEWAIGNCIPVHFSLTETQTWIAKKLV